MEQTRPLQRTPGARTVPQSSPQPVAQAQQVKKPPLNVPKQPIQTQPTIEQTQPVPEKKSKWWLWLIIALAVIGAGVGVYLWVIPKGV